MYFVMWRRAEFVAINVDAVIEDTSCFMSNLNLFHRTTRNSFRVLIESNKAVYSYTCQRNVCHRLTMHPCSWEGGQKHIFLTKFYFSKMFGINSCRLLSQLTTSQASEYVPLSLIWIGFIWPLESEKSVVSGIELSVCGTKWFLWQAQLLSSWCFEIL